MRVRLGPPVVALLLGVHLFMLAGGSGHAAPLPMRHGHIQAMPAGMPAAPALVGQDMHGHDMAAGCLAVIAVLLLLTVPTGSQIARRALERPRGAAAPVLRPPTPPPITLGISRT